MLDETPATTNEELARSLQRRLEEQHKAYLDPEWKPDEDWRQSIVVEG